MKTLINRKSLIIYALMLIFFTGTAFKNDFFEISKQIEIFTTLFKELNMNYVDDTNPGDLMDTAIKNMLDDLDPYTRFLNEQDVQAARIKHTGDYTGIGAKIQTFKDKLLIIEPYQGYPADNAGLKAGDEIIKIDNILVADYKDDIRNLINGAPNTDITITFKRQNETKNVTVTRDEVEIKAVPYYTMIGDKTGYIVLKKFNEKTTSETIDAISDLKKQGATQLILDLRGNPGGLLREAINITNIFVPKGQLVVTTKSKIKKYNKTYVTKNEPIDQNIPLVVLINGNSASASEIVSGALQDLDRAVIIGSRSFGKGLVQRYKDLNYGTQLKVTISKYYTPSGRCIQSLDYGIRDEEGNAVKISHQNEFKTKNGRVVYDGGGVFPDIELDISKNNAIIKAIIKDGLIFDYATKYYYDNTVSDLNSFEFTDFDFNNFKAYLNTNNFRFETKTEDAIKEIIKISEKEGLNANIQQNINTLLEDINTYKNESIDQQKEQLKSLLTDEIISRYFYREGLFEYYSNHNPEIKKAIEILNDPSKYKRILK